MNNYMSLCILICLFTEEASGELKLLQVNYCSSINTLRKLRQEYQEMEQKAQESAKHRDELQKMLSRETKKR